MIKANKSFILDALGNLIELHEARYPSALIPNSVRVATSAEEIAHPYPWTLTPEFALQEILSLPYPLISDTVAENVFKRKLIPRSPFVFVPPVAVQVDDGEVMELLKIYDGLEEMDDGRKLIESELADAGIARMPLMDYCHPETHACSTVERIVEYSQYGWLSHGKIYRKAVPILATTSA